MREIRPLKPDACFLKPDCVMTCPKSSIKLVAQSGIEQALKLLKATVLPSTKVKSKRCLHTAYII